MNLFNPKDYSAICLRISVKNLTSGTDLTPPKKEKGPAPILQLVEFLENGGAVFAFPLGSCPVGHSLGMTLTLKNVEYEHTMSLTAKVLSVVDDEAAGSIISTQFVQYLREDWEQLLRIYSERQKEILVFFESVKGNC